MRKAHIAGFFLGYSQASLNLFVGSVFFVGSLVILKWGYSPADIFVCVCTVFTAIMGAGGAIANTPSFGKARQSASKIFKIIDENSTLDVRECQN